MPLSLAEAAKASQNTLQRGVLETFVQESVVLDRLPMLSIEGNAYAYNKEATLPGIEFRNVNESYSESTGTIVQDTESLAILGGDADVDRFIVQTRGNLMDQRALQTRLKVKAASYFYQDAFINGQGSEKPNPEEGSTPLGFAGLSKRLTGQQVIASGGAGLDSFDLDGIHEFFDMLDEAVSRVPGVNGSNGAIYANSRLISKVVSAGRRIGGVEWIKEDMTGKRAISWNGISFHDLGQNAAGADILPVTADEVTSTNASDLYVVKFGSNEADGGVTGLTNGGVQVTDLGELDSKPVYRTRIEFYTGLATFGGKAAVKVEGVTH